MAYSIILEDGTTITDYIATAICEDFYEKDITFKDTIHAWSYLIGTKLCWKLQGSFGRMASNLIEQGVIETDGTLNWEQIIDEISNTEINESKK